jgi:hypothetical protein
VLQKTLTTASEVKDQPAQVQSSSHGEDAWGVFCNDFIMLVLAVFAVSSIGFGTTTITQKS